jgi:multiple sugar transport system substrate-binding protein
MRHTKRAVTAALLTSAALALTGCAAGDSASDGGDAAASCEPAGEDVTLEFTSWIPGIEDAVAVWNEQNPEIQVEVQTGPNGNSGTYQNFFNQLEAGNAPDLGQIEYDALPNFRVQDGLENLAACEEIVAAEDQFLEWTWGQVSLGTEDEVYGVPQDQGPMALFYRSDLFEQNGIEVPTTWE